MTSAFGFTALPFTSVEGTVSVFQASFLFGACLVCALVLGSIALLSRRVLQLEAKPLVVPCVFCLLAGLALLVMRPLSQGEPFDLLAPLLIGVGGALMVLYWGKAFSQLPQESVIPTTALAICLAAALDLILRFLHPPFDARISAVALILIAALPLEFILLSKQQPSEHRTPRFKPFLTAVWKPYFGFLLCWVIVACTWGTSLSDAGAARPVNLLDGRMIGIIIGGAVLLVLSLARGRLDGRLSSVHAYLSVVATGSLLLSWMLVLISPTLFLLADALVGLGLGLLVVLAWGELSRLARQSGAAFFLFGSAGAFALLVMLAFATLSFFLENTAEFVSPVLILLYLVLSNFNFGKTRGTERTSEVPPDPTRFREQLEGVAATYRLSPREREILNLLASGHSAQFTAESLHISLNSVKTHKQHIYQKTNIHKRDELIALIKNHPFG
jgi:DNA-binding CsgD family transcriptional regulator